MAGGPWLAGQRELLLCALLAWSAAGAIALPGASPRIRPRLSGATGVALGAAVWVKPHALLLAPLLVWWTWLACPPAMRGRALAAVGAGLALPGVAFLTWLGWAGGLASFMDITLGYLIPHYSRLGRSDLLRELAERDYGLDRAPGARSPGPVSERQPSHWHGGARRSPSWRWDSPTAWLTSGSRGAGGSIISTLWRSSWSRSAEPGSARPWRTRRGALTAMLVVALVVTAAALWTKGQRNLAPAWIEAKMARVVRVSEGLRPLVATGGTVQVLDTSAGGVHALFRLKAQQPSRFLYDFHFFHDVGHPYVRRLRAELMDALRARPPAAVVVFAQGWPTGGYERLAGFPELQAWVSTGYRLSEEGDGYRLYVGRAAPR